MRERGDERVRVRVGVKRYQPRRGGKEVDGYASLSIHLSMSKKHSREK